MLGGSRSWGEPGHRHAGWTFEVAELTRGDGGPIIVHASDTLAESTTFGNGVQLQVFHPA